MLRIIVLILLGNSQFFGAAGWRGETFRAEVRGLRAIPPEYHQKIFNVFESLHDAGERAGTGMGLAIVSKGVQRLGGRVGVESELEKGSTFWIKLPGLPQANRYVGPGG